MSKHPTPPDNEGEYDLLADLPETATAKAPDKPDKPPKARLKTLEDCRRAQANIYNRLNQDELEESKAGKLSYIVTQTAACIKELALQDIDKRLAALEAKI